MRHTLLALALLTGCASGDDDAPDCSPLSGTYVASFRERAGGSCGPMTDLVITLGGEADALPAGCTGSRTSDTCSSTSDVACADGTRTVTVCRANGPSCVITLQDAGRCISTYDVTLKKQ